MLQVLGQQAGGGCGPCPRELSEQCGCYGPEVDEARAHEKKHETGKHGSVRQRDGYVGSSMVPFVMAGLEMDRPCVPRL